MCCLANPSEQLSPHFFRRAWEKVGPNTPSTFSVFSNVRIPVSGPDLDLIPSRRRECFITPDQGLLEKQVFQPGRFVLSGSYTETTRNLIPGGVRPTAIVLPVSLLSLLSCPVSLWAFCVVGAGTVAGVLPRSWRALPGRPWCDSCCVRIARVQDVQFFFAHQP